QESAPQRTLTSGPSTQQVAGAFLGLGLMSGAAATGLTLKLADVEGSSVRNTVRARNVALGMAGGALLLSGALYLVG
ncbi:hypothetical protein ACXYS1_27655, partial [Escherichia coli]